MNSSFFWEQPVRADLTISQPFKEAIPPVANKDDLVVHERLASLETKSALAERVSKLEASFESVVTWHKLLLSLGIFVGLLAALMMLYHNTMLPSQIESVVSRSPSLEKRFTGLENQYNSINDKLDKQLSVSPILNPKILGAVLKDAASSDSGSIAAAIPKIRTMLTIGREQKIPIADKDYSEISKPLFLRYAQAKPALQKELWLTFIDLANTKITTDSVLRPLSDSEIAKAKASNNFFENKDVDLSSRTTWKDTIFKNCKIKISASDNNLVLTNVRFEQGEFQFPEENKTGVKFLQAVLEQGEPRITSTVVKYSVHVSIPKNGKT